MSTPLKPYAAAHQFPKDCGDARPTAVQATSDASLSDSMADEVVLVNEGSSGMGVETDRALYTTGARGFMQV